jgi:hypothetical protein
MTRYPCQRLAPVAAYPNPGVKNSSGHEPRQCTRETPLGDPACILADQHVRRLAYRTCPMLGSQQLINALECADQLGGGWDYDQAAKLRLRSTRNRKVESSHIVAGVHDHRAPSGYKPDITAGRSACPMQPPRRCTTQCRRFHVDVPRNALPADTFGFDTRRSRSRAIPAVTCSRPRMPPIHVLLPIPPAILILKTTSLGSRLLMGTM